jgi:hypothetical protein
MGWSLRWLRMSRYRRIGVGSGRRLSIVVPVGRMCIHKWFPLKRFETFFKSAAEERVFLYLHTIALLGYLKNPEKFENQSPKRISTHLPIASSLASYPPNTQG